MAKFAAKSHASLVKHGSHAMTRTSTMANHAAKVQRDTTQRMNSKSVRIKAGKALAYEVAYGKPTGN